MWSFDPEGKLYVEGVLFDFDGTLFDTIPLIVESYHHVYRAFGLREHTDEEIKAGIGLPLEEVFEREYPEIADELLEAYLEHNHRITKTHVGVYLGIFPMLESLRALGLPLGVVTAKREKSMRMTLEQFEGERFFQAIVSKDDTSRHKPDPEPLILGMKKLGLEDPSTVLYVGDSVHDLEAARNGGFPSAAVGWSAMPRETLEAAEPVLWIERAEAFAGMLHPLKEGKKD